MSTVKLHIGCGGNYLPGYINVDRGAVKHDLTLDLNQTRWDLPDNYADEILINNTLEHLVEPDQKMFELHRILKPGCALIGEVPYAKSDGAFQMEHKWFFTEKSFDAFCDGAGFYSSYQKPLFKMVYVRLSVAKNTPKTKMRNLIPTPVRMLLRHFLWNMFDDVQFKLIKI